MNKSKLTFIACISLIFILIPVFAFDWPQDDVSTQKLSSFFGQKRSNTFSNSLIFSEAETAKSSDKGSVTVVITEHDDGFNWFESTLGNAVIVSHEDSLLTVYGNLDKDGFNREIFTNPLVQTGTEFSTTGNSAWQKTENYLEFQIIDTKNNNFVNPLILMPRLGKELPITLTGITLQNKFGKLYDLDTQKNIPAGVYKIYRKRQDIAMPYKTEVLVNGAVSEKITYDTLSQHEGELTAKGEKLYTEKDIYPDDSLMLMGELYLPHGKDTISIIATTFSGVEYTKIFNISVF